ncbi:cytochrome c [Sulfitobacter sp. HNIBRBA3233]|uniref:c-type cytochrome n=1 Tax=Sulfitobacter marinivivus TaxID=3158558 RepID=UPI0032DFCB86
MKRFFGIVIACALIGAGVFWWVTRPAPVMAAVAEGHVADSENGALVFAAAGCSSCHAAPEGEDKTLLAGGHSFATDFGTFYAPNISPGPDGIGGWTLPDFARALRQGVSPEGRHYYPAFPYTSYVHMTDGDVADLWAYMNTLPVSETPSRAHEVSFPFNVTRGLGLWKALYLKTDFVVAQTTSAEVERGRYLVEALGHCAECHTPRDALGGLDREAWLSGAPNPSGKGEIPDLTSEGLDWSEADLVAYFTSGFTPDYDSVGGTMAAVVDNLAQLPEDDRAAIAAYVKALP